MRLMRWEPFREMDDLLKGFGPPFARAPFPGRPMEGEFEFVPAADIVEREKEYVVKVDLPDVRKEDLKVLFDDGVLTIRGERKVEKEVNGEKVHRTERFCGTFERSFALPEDVETKGIRAECKDGVLMVTLPRVAVAKPRPLAITIQ
ncbi:MAG: Hsp20/alpha crystallin family protein [Steroidobacteraceae bacterium]